MGFTSGGIPHVRAAEVNVAVIEEPTGVIERPPLSWCDIAGVVSGVWVERANATTAQPEEIAPAYVLIASPQHSRHIGGEILMTIGSY